MGFHIDLVLDSTVPYYAGKWLSGEVHLRLKRPTKLCEIYVQLKAKCQCVRSAEDSSTKQREDYLDLRVPLSFLNTFPDGNITPGVHKISFRLQLPTHIQKAVLKKNVADYTLPSSTKTVSRLIVYNVRAGAIMPDIEDTLGGMIRTEKVPITFVGISDLTRLQLPPSVLKPHEFEECNEPTGCCIPVSSGTVWVYVRIPKAVYSYGDDIPITLKIQNNSSVRIRGISATVSADYQATTDGEHCFVRLASLSALSNFVEDECADELQNYYQDFICDKHDTLEWHNKALYLEGVPPVLFGCNLFSSAHRFELKIPGVCKVQVPIYVGTVLPQSPTTTRTAEPSAPVENLEIFNIDDYRKHCFHESPPEYESPPPYETVVGGDY